MLEWFKFVLATYKFLNITRAEQVWNGDETAIASQDNVSSVDSVGAHVVRIYGLKLIFLVSYLYNIPA